MQALEEFRVNNLEEEKQLLEKLATLDARAFKGQHLQLMVEFEDVHTTLYGGAIEELLWHGNGNKNYATLYFKDRRGKMQQFDIGGHQAKDSDGRPVSDYPKYSFKISIGGN